MGYNGGQLPPPPPPCAIVAGIFVKGGGGLPNGDETPVVWKGSTEDMEGTERGMHCQEGTDSEGGGGQEKDRLCFISDLSCLFCVAWCGSLCCRGLEFESKFKLSFR